MLRSRLGLAIIALGGLVTACGQHATESALGPPSDRVKGPNAQGSGNPHGGGGAGGAADPTVSSVDPDSTVQGQTLDVLIIGNDFEPGSSVEWLLAGQASADIQTNSTTFLSKRQLRANISVAGSATPAFYDVQVTTPPGRRGIGSELLQVTEDVPVEITMRDAVGDEITSDGNGVYATGACGEARFNLGDAILGLLGQGGGKKKRSECGDGRLLLFTGFPPDSPGGADRTGRHMSVEDIQSLPIGVETAVTAGFSAEGCAANLHFDPARGGSHVLVTRVSIDTWQVYTQPAPNNTAVCLASDLSVKFTLQMDFGATITVAAP